MALISAKFVLYRLTTESHQQGEIILLAWMAVIR